MTFNSQTIIQAARADFDKMIDFVQGKEARTATAGHIERGLFKLLLVLGAKLLTAFFIMRCEAGSRQTITREDGQKLSYQRDSKRAYYSIFGKVELYRPYFYRKGLDGELPLETA